MRGLQSAIGAVALCMLATTVVAQQSDPPASERLSDIGYPSAAAALEALKATKDVAIALHDDWIRIEDERRGMTLWDFTRASHPAHPSAVKRVLIEKNGDLTIEMNVLCEASKSACDSLAADFREKNEQMRAAIVRRFQQRMK